jgi:FKBP-type peptidyl-prolyl cis-trans isomerase FklB
VEQPTVEPVQLVSDIDSVSYAVGLVNGGSLVPYLGNMGVDTAYIADVKRGFIDASRVDANSREAAYYVGAKLFLDLANQMNKGIFMGDSVYQVSRPHLLAGIVDGMDNNHSLMDPTVMQPKIDGMVKRMREKASEHKYAGIKEAGKNFLAENSTKEGVVTLPSGLQYKVLREGTGTVAGQNDMVTVNYEGRLLDGTVFDSSYERGEPAKFRPTQVIKGWTEALTLMPEGSMWELYIPENLAYGDREAGKIPPYSTLIFKVEVIKVGEDAPKK